MHLDNLIRNIIFDILSAIEISFAGEILAFDEKKMVADVKPLLQYAKQQLPTLKNVPVEITGGAGFFIRPIYKKGDIVRLTVSGSAIQRAILEKRPIEMKTIEKFLIGNCTVSSGLVGKNPPSVFQQKSGLLIGKDNVYLHFSENSIEILGNVQINGNVVVNGNISALDFVAGLISFVAHKHISSPPSTPTSPPVP